MGHTWGLTGRAEELRFIEHATRWVPGDANVARGVVLAGDAGVGKTRLAREVIGRAQQRGVCSRWVSATASARRLPLGALAEFVDVLAGDPADLVVRATEAVLADGGATGTVVAIDDAHLLDDLSATVVHRLSLATSASLVLTVRTGQPAPDAVTALWKDGPLQRLEVQPLSESETVTLLEAVLGGPLDSAAFGRIWRMTQGNALYLRQLVDAELEAGRLHLEAGVWRWTGEVALSAALTELVASRMGALRDRRARATAALMEAWLQFASGAVAWDATVPLADGTDIAFLDLMSEAEATILDLDATDDALLATEHDLRRVLHAG